MDLGIGGKRAAVAAASRGLGLGVARALAAEGVKVAICGRDPETIKSAAAGLDGDAVPIVADVSSVDGAEGFVRDARAALGGIDILVLNAGGPPAGDFAHTTVDQYLEAFARPSSSAQFKIIQRQYRFLSHCHKKEISGNVFP